MRLKKVKKWWSNLISKINLSKMIELPEIQELIGQTVKSLYVVVWNPNYCEPIDVIDITFGFILNEKPTDFLVLTRDINDIWTPELKSVPFPTIVRNWSEFDAMMSRGDEDYYIDYEYFDVSDLKEFSNIVNSEIKEIHKIGVRGIKEPLGVKIIFENDYIISLPSSDGNTIETKIFNENNHIRRFQYLGKIKTEIIMKK